MSKHFYALVINHGNSQKIISFSTKRKREEALKELVTALDSKYDLSRYVITDWRGSVKHKNVDVSLVHDSLVMDDDSYGGPIFFLMGNLFDREGEELPFTIYSKKALKDNIFYVKIKIIEIILLIS